LASPIEMDIYTYNSGNVACDHIFMYIFVLTLMSYSLLVLAINNAREEMMHLLSKLVCHVFQQVQ